MTPLLAIVLLSFSVENAALPTREEKLWQAKREYLQAKVEASRAFEVEKTITGAGMVAGGVALPAVATTLLASAGFLSQRRSAEPVQSALLLGTFTAGAASLLSSCIFTPPALLIGATALSEAEAERLVLDAREARLRAHEERRVSY